MALELWRQLILYQQLLGTFCLLTLYVPILVELYRNHLLHSNFRQVLILAISCTFAFYQESTDIVKDLHLLEIYQNASLYYFVALPIFMYTVRTIVGSTLMTYGGLLVQLIIPVIIVPLFHRLYHQNRKIHEYRFHMGFDLLSTYQVEENMRATRTVIPMCVAQFICMAINTMAYGYCLFFTDVPLGTDTGPISHLFQQVSLMDRAALFILLLHRLGKGRQKRREISDIDADQAAHSKKYFNDLKMQWGDL
ncbi:unnamed protein product, partial [Mesorhabditis spiculigera]